MPEFPPIEIENDELLYDAIIRRLKPVLSRLDLYDLAAVIDEIYAAAIRDKAENE